MGVPKLRSHIPISAPARREPADGTESDMRVSLGFEPAWFHKRCGVDFSERWHKDPCYRYESLKKMKTELFKAFPAVPYWDISKTDDLATLSGCYGAYVIARVFGMPLRYDVDLWPLLTPERKLSVEEIEKLEIEKLLEGPFVKELLHQMDIIESEWGKISGYLNWQGVLNNYEVRKSFLISMINLILFIIWDPAIQATIIRDEHYKLNVYHRDPGLNRELEGELYDVVEDKDEAHNLWDNPAHRNVRLKMTEKLLDWIFTRELQLRTRGGGAVPHL